jgi:hypothetical protein
MMGDNSSPAGNAESSTVDAVDDICFLFSLVLIVWFWDCRRTYLGTGSHQVIMAKINIMPSGKDQQGVTSSGL